MDNLPHVSIAQRLAIEKQLLAEEKLLVYCLKTIREERYACQREGGMYLSVLEALTKGKERKNEDSKQTEETLQTEKEPEETPAMDELPLTNNAASSQPHEINLDNIPSNEVALDLTVPSHNLGHMMEDEYEEFEDLDSDDDYEIDMGMFMYGSNNTTDGQGS